MMNTLIQVAQLVGFILIVSFAGVIVHGLLTGRINTRGMTSRSDYGDSLSRSFGVVVTIISAAAYMITVFTVDLRLGFPTVPEPILWALGAASGVYLVGKAVPFIPTSGLRDLFQFVGNLTKRGS